MLRLSLEKMEFPDTVIQIAVEPKTKADQEKMGTALSKTCRRKIQHLKYQLTKKLDKHLLQEWESYTWKSS